MTDKITIERETLEDAYAAGWCAAAMWADREDLVSVDVLAYIAERDTRLKQVAVQTAPAESKDAARWAAFRNAVATEDESFLGAVKNYPFSSSPVTAAEVDAAIDAAMKGTP